MTRSPASNLPWQALRLQEVEVSITSRCTLACAECGFLVPRQPPPSRGNDPVQDVSSVLSRLHAIGVGTRSLAVMGGEPTIDGAILGRAIRAIRATNFTERLEVVTNGLTPAGLVGDALAAIDQVTISVYGVSEGLLDRWRRWLSLSAPHVRLVLRRNEGGWDAWTEFRQVSVEEAQRMYERCWFRRHCVTVERGRLFLCSRIAKLSQYAEGIPIDSGTSIEDVRSYLNRSDALASCASCTPMMNLPAVTAGVQPDDRVASLEPRATAWLDAAIERASVRPS
jgi:hypothetical protein